MGRIQSLEDLDHAKKVAVKNQKESQQDCQFLVRVSTASCGVAAGALRTLESIQESIAAQKLENVCIKEIGCLGLCSLEPIVQVQEKDRALVTYGKVNRIIAQRIVREHLEKGLVVQEYVIDLL